MRWFHPKESYLTCRDRDDGGGAQVSARISAMILAHLKGMTYAHSPMADVAHVPDGTDPKAWSEAWEKTFNLGKDEISAADIEIAGFPVYPIEKAHRFIPRSQRLQVIAHAHKITNDHPNEWAAIAPEIRAKYFSSPKPKLPWDAQDTLRIAVHLRRGDVDPTGHFSERYTEDQAIIDALTHLLNAIGSKRCTLHLFSQGNPADFADFADLGAQLHLDEDVFTSFHHLVTADILFTAKSTFSWLAGIIGHGLIIYEPFWHPPLPEWLDLTKVASSPANHLMRLSSEALASR